MDVDALVEALTSHSYRYANEIQLQDAIEKVLKAEGFEYAREVDLGKKDRIDFVVYLPKDVPIGEVYGFSSVGIEVKIAESLSNMTRQLARYAKSPEIDTIVLATASMRLLHTVPDEFQGKKIRAIYVGGAF